MPKRPVDDRPRSLVTNTTNEAQLDYAEKRVERDVNRFLDALKAVLDTYDGRVVMHALALERRSDDPFDANPYQHAYNAAINVVARKIEIECEAVNPTAYGRMFTEHRQWKRDRDAEIDAMHASAEQQGENDGE